MFRLTATPPWGRMRFPRIRGDVPPVPYSAPIHWGFSPHTRGCSAVDVTPIRQRKVFPAYAGMFRDPLGSGSSNHRFPRIRGDVPCSKSTSAAGLKFSPHTRGCSGGCCGSCSPCCVFPAYAGMFLGQPSAAPPVLGFPRIRGDVPWPTLSGATRIRFSPHTRGCSVFGKATVFFDFVFPAYAGMFRCYVTTKNANGGFPRIRGDVP